MIHFRTIRSAIARGLRGALSIMIVEINSPGDAPLLPYGTYDFSVGAFEATGQPVKSVGEDSITISETVEFSVDFQFAAADRGHALELALTARDWFGGAGHEALKYGPAGIVVVTIEQVNNRDVQIGDDWTYQYGFEVQFRTTSVAIMQNQYTIDKATIKEDDPIV